jgi:hypothetical protein
MTARPSYFTFTPSNESTTGFASGLSGAGPFGPFSAIPDGLAHQVSLTSAGNLSAITFTITGPDADGVTISESLAGPNVSTVETTRYFKQVTQITVSSTTGATTFDVGWVDEFVSKTIPLEIFLGLNVNCQVTLTGTANFDIEDTMSDIRASSPPPGQHTYTWLNDANFTAKSASLSSPLAVVARAIRLAVNSYTSGAILDLGVITPR